MLDIKKQMKILASTTQLKSHLLWVLSNQHQNLYYMDIINKKKYYVLISPHLLCYDHIMTARLHLDEQKHGILSILNLR